MLAASSREQAHYQASRLSSIARFNASLGASLGQQRAHERLYMMALSSASAGPGVASQPDASGRARELVATLRGNLRRGLARVWPQSWARAVGGQRASGSSSLGSRPNSGLSPGDMPAAGLSSEPAGSLLPLHYQLALLHHPAAFGLVPPHLAPRLFAPALFAGPDCRPPPPSYHASLIQDHIRWRLGLQQQAQLRPAAAHQRPSTQLQPNPLAANAARLPAADPANQCNDSDTTPNRCPNQSSETTNPQTSRHLQSSASLSAIGTLTSGDTYQQAQSIGRPNQTQSGSNLGALNPSQAVRYGDQIGVVNYVGYL